jgi:aminoglycoside N3'-acetyltransferase
MKEKLYVLIRRLTGPKTRSKIKSFLLNFRKRYSKVFTLLHGTFSSEDLKNEILSKIGNDYDVLMVHTSFDQLLPMYQGNVYELLKMLLQITDGKTLAMPAFTFGGSDPEILKNFKKKPYFDRKKSPTQVGLINELFRRYPGVKRSLHPTTSVCAYGPLAEELTATHHLSKYKMGPQTPFGIMDTKKTVILGNGVYYFRNLTHVHTVEYTPGIEFPHPYIKKYETVNVTLIDGEKKLDYELNIEINENAPQERNLSLLYKIMSSKDLLQWKYKGVPLFFAKANKITESLAKSAKEGVTIYNYKIK